MTQYTNDSVMNAACNAIATANIVTLCSQAPTTRTEAVTTYALADAALTPGDGNDFTVADGTTGRRVTMAAQSGALIDTTGVGTHIALCDGSNLLHITRVSNQLAAGTAQAGGASTITLASGESGTDDVFNNYGIILTGGTGAGQARIISDYVGSTKVATVSQAWSVQPDATTTYIVFGVAVTANGVNAYNFPAIYVEFADPVEV